MGGRHCLLLSFVDVFLSSFLFFGLGKHGKALETQSHTARKLNEISTNEEINLESKLLEEWRELIS
jgi:hypothetical protein